MNPSNLLKMIVPLLQNSGIPGANLWMMKRSICVPTFLWSLRLASSIASRCSLSSDSEGKLMQYTRCIDSLDWSPLKYAAEQL